MSIKNWNAGIIRPVAVAPAGPLANGAAPGVWTLDQQAFWQKQGLWPVAGNFLYIEDVFSTYLYTGTGAAQTITNGIDLSGKGGLVWMKGRSGATDHALYDTARGATFDIASNLTTGQTTQATGLTTFGSTGFSIGALAKINTNAATYASWTFREQPKFFDVVTYTGTGANRTIAHNLGSVPGCIMIKRTDTTAAWAVYHRSLANTQYMVLNTTAAAATGATYWNSTTPTSSVFSLGTSTVVNASGGTYVAYLFAHDAGGFGATGADNVISCGSFTTDGSGNATVSLGYEPQWLMVKNATTASNNEWRMVDNMRGFPVDGQPSSILQANSTVAESTSGTINVLNTGFQIDGLANSATFIYIAIRRGPMRTPTTGTSVYNAITRTGTGSAATVTGIGFPPDMVMSDLRTGPNGYTLNRLAGFTNTASRYLVTPFTNSEAGADTATSGFLLDGTTTGTISITTGSSNQNVSGSAYIEYFFRRAPGFFDVVCYTGTGVATTFNHNLGAVPELMIVKKRSAADPWTVYYGNPTKSLELNSNAAAPGSDTISWNSTSPTSSVFTVGVSDDTNGSGFTFVNYLFTTVAGVSKVGSYTGTGTTKQIDCGFTAGARFVLIKRTDSTGDWYVWDSARGIVAGNDPYLLLNSTAAEVTGTDYVDTYSAGFEISSTAPAAINANGGSFIFLAIA